LRSWTRRLEPGWPVGRIRLLERVDLVVSEVQAPDVPVVSESLHQVPRTQQQLLFLDGKGVGKEAR
jgi:hypothetical protein